MSSGEKRREKDGGEHTPADQEVADHRLLGQRNPSGRHCTSAGGPAFDRPDTTWLARPFAALCERVGTMPSPAPCLILVSAPPGHMRDSRRGDRKNTLRTAGMSARCSPPALKGSLQLAARTRPVNRNDRRSVAGKSRPGALCFLRNVHYRLADLGSCHPVYARFRYLVPSVGKMDTVEKVAQSCRRPICAVSLLRGVPF